MISYYSAWRCGVLHLTKFRMKDFWSVDLVDYDAISIFGVSPAMIKLQDKIEIEAKKGTRIICFRFPMKQKTPIWFEDELFLYEI